MPEIKGTFNAYNELQEYFFSGIKKTAGIISLIKEEANIRNKLAELQREDSKITEQIKSLKVSLKLVEKEDVKKAIEEIISKLEKELEKAEDEFDELNCNLADCEAERAEYESYIKFLSDLDDEHCFWSNNSIIFEEFSINEFIAFIFVITNNGQAYFPTFNKKNMPETLHKVIDTIPDDWNSFIEWIEKN